MTILGYIFGVFGFFFKCLSPRGFYSREYGTYFNLKFSIFILILYQIQ